MTSLQVKERDGQPRGVVSVKPDALLQPASVSVFHEPNRRGRIETLRLRGKDRSIGSFSFTIQSLHEHERLRNYGCKLEALN